MFARPHIAAVALVAGLVGTAWASPASSPTGSASAAKKGVKIVSASTGDTDRDGAIDRVYARFSRAVKGRPKASAFTVAGYRVTGKPRANGPYVTLQVAERPGCDVGALPKLAFRGRGLKSGGRTVRASKIDMARRNRSFPRITCAVTADGDRDGRLDSLVLTYSKTVRNRAVAAGGGPFSVEGYAVASVGRARGRSLTLGLRERSAPDTGARPAIQYKRPRGRSVYAIHSGKSQAFSGTFKAVRDRVAPMLVSARTLDRNSDGSLDGVTTAWTEPVSSPHGFSVAGARVTAAGASGNAVDLTLAEGAHNTGARPALSYAAVAVRDESGNGSGAGSATPADGAAPVLQGARTADRSQDGRVDTVTVSFSEPVSHAADSDGGYPFSVSGYGLAGAGGSSGSSVDLSLSEGSGPDTGARPAVSYSRGNGSPVVDGAGNEAAGRAFAGTVDGVAPRLLSATTLDSDLNGRLDKVRFEFSEPVSHGAESGGGSFSATGLTPLSVQGATDRIVDLTLSEATSPNTGARPMASYSPDGSNDVVDAAGNRAAASSLPSADGAKPIVVAAVTGDSSPPNGRIDRVALTFSEDVNHARDDSAPFSFDPAGRLLTAVSAASGTGLSLELQEAGTPDTGAAPTVDYTGAGTPATDSSGNQSPTRSYAGLTRDGVAPRLLSARTADANGNGRIDRVNVRYSEDVTASSGFSVSGRTLQSTTAVADVVRLSIAEAGPGAFDTASRPAVTYAPGDVADQPEGPGDTTDGAQGFSVPSADDGAGPVLTAARTLDANANGTLDGVRASFSEPVSHPLDSAAPFALRIPQRTETSISAPQGSQGDQLTVALAEAAAPDGGLTPDVQVIAGGGVRDKATPANDALALTFDQTSDGVAPRLVSAQLGESGASSCQGSPAVDGTLDCVQARFSEPVSHAGDSSGPYALSLDGDFTIPNFPTVIQVETIDLPLNAGGAPDRDRGANMQYATGPGVLPVVDPSGNGAIDTTLAAARACPDTTNDGSTGADNDTRASAASVQVLEPSRQRHCAFDDDWYRLSTTSIGRARVSVRPSSGLDPQIALFDGSGTQQGSVADSAGPGQTEELDATGLSPGTDYFIRVTAAGDSEGPYCMALSNTDEQPSCGPLAGEVILTEGRFEGSGEKFLELKNVSDFDLDTRTAGLSLRIGPELTPITNCTLQLPAGDAAVLSSGEYAVVTDSGGPGPFRCAGLNGLPAGGTPVQVLADDSPIDSVDFSGLLASPLTVGHSLQLKSSLENSTGNDEVMTSWCRTWGADSRGSQGDGCDEYRVNEILFDPVSSGPDGNDGRAFVELAGNLPSMPNAGGPSKLLEKWVLRGAEGENGDGTPDFVLPANASPRDNGVYVVADAVDDASPPRTNLAPGSWDVLWEGLNLGDPSWPAYPSDNAGPRGLQLLRPSPPANPPCAAALADVVGWRQTSEPFLQTSDSLRGCALVETDPIPPLATAGPSLARDNLSSGGDTGYNAGNDTDFNSADFCRQAAPNPGQLNVRPPCGG